jgi:uracil-DNA glycosylase
MDRPAFLAASKSRGTPVSLADGATLAVTIHLSAILRIEDEAEKRSAYNSFVADLKAARAILDRRAA